VGIEHREPTVATVKELYANAWRCGKPECMRPLYRVDPESGSRILNSRVAHICARREGGPRWNPEMTEDENRSADNLILLCLEHASEIDDKNRVEAFPTSLIQEWKRQQLAEFDSLGYGGWTLTDGEASEVLDSSRRTSFSIRDSSIALGGQGGQAPGAGGGGGGVLGSHAVGGRGGKGGDLSFEGQPGQAPGAGGGGAGASGHGAVGGEGGEGGEYVEEWFSVDELPEVVEIKVGRGGRGVPGGDGPDGEDTTFGDLLRAKGGRGGRAGRMGAVPYERGDPSAVRVSAAFFAHSAEARDGLVYVLGGGWDTYSVPTLPGVLNGCLVFIFEYDGNGTRRSYDVRVEVASPAGETKGSSSMVLPFDAPPTKTVRAPHVVGLSVGLEVPGTWVARVAANGKELARIPLDVVATQPA
jgi:hypothetical protein